MLKGKGLAIAAVYFYKSDALSVAEPAALKTDPGSKHSIIHHSVILYSLSAAITNTAPTIWNTLPLDIHNSPSISVFVATYNIFLQPSF